MMISKDWMLVFHCYHDNNRDNYDDNRYMYDDKHHMYDDKP